MSVLAYTKFCSVLGSPRLLFIQTIYYLEEEVNSNGLQLIHISSAVKFETKKQDSVLEGEGKRLFISSISLNPLSG